MESSACAGHFVLVHRRVHVAFKFARCLHNYFFSIRMVPLQRGVRLKSGVFLLDRAGKLRSDLGLLTVSVPSTTPILTHGHGSKPRTPSVHIRFNPTTEIGSKMGGGFTYSTLGFDHSHIPPGSID